MVFKSSSSHVVFIGFMLEFVIEHDTSATNHSATPFFGPFFEISIPFSLELDGVAIPNPPSPPPLGFRPPVSELSGPFGKKDSEGREQGNLFQNSVGRHVDWKPYGPGLTTFN